ncbi:SigB/SigF/SigG family RNA polymerase sigma factor [Streptomyces sp. NPDC005279]|uniref:SigB/SigF/SigG family RNA polymerase sigma factor n=1 Tax=Streptomyces sp. NPDC005279 TaxID=3364712 RepID=UPI00368EFEDB
MHTAAKAIPADGRDLPWVEDGRKVAPRDARQLTILFLERLRVLEEGTHEHQYVRNTLIEMNLSLVRYAAGPFRNRGDGEMEDIFQVGTIGLIKAIDRFDLSRGVAFSFYALPYIRGEIMRYFRDASWAVHVPRRLQELRVELARARERLAAELDRDPTARELATHLRLSEEEVREGLVAAAGYTAGSLDAPNVDPDTAPASLASGRSFADRIGINDHDMELVEDFHTLAHLLDGLDDRERAILELRFGKDMTQAQIARELGVSQMHISRLLNHTLHKLRTGMLGD